MMRFANDSKVACMPVGYQDFHNEIAEEWDTIQNCTFLLAP